MEERAVMQSGTDSGTPAQSDDRDAIYHAVVADLASLIERIQASLAMIEAAVAGEASAAVAEMAANVVVLDDVTPRYLKAGAALKACDAGLGVALHFLSETEPGMHDTAGNRRTPHSSIN
jgi:hypothetical protein